MLELSQILLIIVALVTIISILPENSDKARNMLAGAMISGAIMIFMRGEDPHIIYDSLIKWDVIVLIIFLTIFVDMLDELGYFEYIGIQLVKRTGGSQKFLYVAFGVMMFFMSAFLDNVTAIILLSSLTITVCKRLEISPVPYLIYQTFLTGVGALLTPVGSVPNIILNSGAGIAFGTWVGQMAVFAFLSLGISTVYFLFLHRDFLSEELSEEKKEELEYLDPNQVINSMKDVYLSTGLILALVVSFILAERIHVGIELMAVLLAVSTMIITGIRSKEMWAKIDWNTLFFFSGLFVLVGSLEQSDALLPLASVIEGMIADSPGMLLIVLIIFGGLASTGLNNIPISLLFTSIFASIGVVGVQFWYGAVIATNIGASLTPIGSVIVIIAFEVLKKSGYEISIGKYFKETFPLFVLISLLGFGYLTILVSLGVL
ncbi:MAG: SLC13 family permease [Candidatus Kariarchaeaceae archaeon]|jgi:Na+/H+ antiporter NhaD/arsenite permease-like protein